MHGYYPSLKKRLETPFPTFLSAQSFIVLRHNDIVISLSSFLLTFSPVEKPHWHVMSPPPPPARIPCFEDTLYFLCSTVGWGLLWCQGICVQIPVLYFLFFGQGMQELNVASQFPDQRLNMDCSMKVLSPKH